MEVQEKRRPDWTLFSPPPAAEWLGTALLLLCVAIAATSWINTELTSNEFHHFADLRLTFTFFVLFVGLAVVYEGVVVGGRPPSTRFLLTGFAAFSTVLLLSFPVGAKDVFLYAFYGKMWGAYGRNPYIDPPIALAADDWFRYLRNTWFAGYPAGYGPLFLEQCWLFQLIAGGRLLSVIAAYKLFNFLLVGVSAWLIWKLRVEVGGAASPAARIRCMVHWLWCPLVLFESLGAAHNDLMLAVLLLAACLAWMRGRDLIAAACLILSVWYKWYTVVLVPVWLVWSLRRWGGRQAMGRLGGAMLIALPITAIVLFPFRASLIPMLTRVGDFQNVRALAPTELPPPLWLAFHTGRVLGLFQLDAGPMIFDVGRALVFLAGLGLVIWRRRGCAYASGLFLEDVLWTLLLFFGLVVTMLWPWHLLSIGALAVASGRSDLEGAWAFLHAVAMLSYFLTFGYALVFWGLVCLSLGLVRRSRLSGA